MVPPMRAHVFRTDPPALVQTLTAPEWLARYQDLLAAEAGVCAEREMLGHLRRMGTLAGRAATEGFDTLARNDRTSADALLTDLFAVATWHQVELPAAPLGELEVDVTDLPAGLLASDTTSGAARLWQLDGTTIALTRDRVVGDTVRLDGHARA